jgi:hypothetical protein
LAVGEAEAKVIKKKLLAERIVRIKAVPPDRVYGRSLIRPCLAASDSAD